MATATLNGNIYGGYNSTNSSSVNGKTNSVLAIASSAGSQSNNFYAFASLWRTGDACSWANYWPNSGPIANCATQPCNGGCGSAPANHGGLIASLTNGYSWKESGPSFDFCTITGGTSPANATFGGYFVNSSHVGYCPSSFIQFGPGNTLVPGSIGGGNYVYMFAVNVVDQFNSRYNNLSPKHVYLMRAPAKSIEQLSTWQYFTGLDVNGVPTWVTYSSDNSYTNIQPIYTDLNPVGTAANSAANSAIGCSGIGFDLKENMQDAVYNPALNRYVGSAQGNAIGQTSFFEAPQPWGPWSVVQYNNFDLTNLPSSGWGNFGVGPQAGACASQNGTVVWQGSSGVALGVHFINAYSTASSMQAIYSSDGIAPATALSDVAGNYWDSFNAVTFYFNTNPPK